MTFSPHFGRGGISIFGRQNPGSKRGEKILSTLDKRFPKMEYNILSSWELNQKVIVAQQLLDSKCRHRLQVH